MKSIAPSKNQKQRATLSFFANCPGSVAPLRRIFLPFLSYAIYLNRTESWYGLDNSRSLVFINSSPSILKGKAFQLQLDLEDLNLERNTKEFNVYE